MIKYRTSVVCDLCRKARVDCDGKDSIAALAKARRRFWKSVACDAYGNTAEFCPRCATKGTEEQLKGMVLAEHAEQGEIR